MTPPRLAAFTAAVLVLLAATPAILGATIGIDLGAEYFKIVSVTQGQGIDIVLNEQSSRKTSTFIGFRGEDRYIGEDARALAPRFPSNMLTYINLLLGEKYSDKEVIERFKNKLLLTYDLLEDEKRGTFRIKVGANETYSVEELLAMQMAYIKTTAEKYLDQNANDAVIAVPSHFNLRQRQIVTDAAELGGLNVLTLIDHSIAAALQYGVNNRGFANGRTVIIVDYGASGLEVGVFKFDPLPPQISKKKSGDVWGGMHVLAVESDGENGGRYMDAKIAELIARRFQEKKGIDLLTRDDSEGRKAKVKLMRSAQKAKETLSANRDVQLTVEGLWDEQDFVTTVTRADFDAEIAGLVSKAMEVVERAVKNSGLDIKEIEVLEMMGGNTRVPAFQDKLQEFFGRNLGRSLNTDEAIAFGAAFQSARLSGSFRVRSFTLHQNSTNNFQFRLSATEEIKNPTARPMFPNSPLPSRRVVVVPRVEDFNVTVLLKGTETEQQELAEVQILKVKKAFEKMGYFKDEVHPDSQASVELQFELTEGDTLALASAIAKFKQVKVVNVTATDDKKARKAKDTSFTKEDGKDKTEGEKEKTEEKKEEKAEGEDKAEKKEEKTEEKPAEEKPATEPKEAAEGAEEGDAEPKTKTVISTLKQDVTVKIRNILTPLPLSEADRKVSQAVLQKLDKRDEEKRQVSEARNTLETLIYSTKYDGFLDNEELKPYFNETTEEDVRKVLTEVEEWLESDEGSSAGYKELRNKTKEIQKATAPVHDAVEAKKAEERAAELKKVKEEAAKKAAEKKAAADKKKKAKKAAAEEEEEEKEDEADEKEEKEDKSDEAEGEADAEAEEKEAAEEGEGEADAEAEGEAKDEL